MNCFIGLVLVAGVYLNPCVIADMTDIPPKYRNDQHQCLVRMNGGDAWNGRYVKYVDAKCSDVQKAIEQKKEKQ